MQPNPDPDKTVAISRETAEYLLELLDYLTPQKLKNDPQLRQAVQELEAATGIHYLSPDTESLTEEQLDTVARIHEEASRETGLTGDQAVRKTEARILTELYGHCSD